MLTIKYSVPVNEVSGDNGETIRTTQSVIFDENTATTELLADEVRKLEAQGYDVTATLKLKSSKRLIVVGFKEPTTFIYIFYYERKFNGKPYLSNRRKNYSSKAHADDAAIDLFVQETTTIPPFSTAYFTSWSPA